MNTRSLVSFMAVSALFSATAQAGVFIEPNVGYHFGTTSIKSVSGFPSGDVSFNGLGFGARAGLMMGKSFFFAGDFSYGMLTDEEDADFTHMSVGGVIGAKFSALRIWGGVNVINEFQDDATDGKFKGMGFKAGLGYMLANSVSLNVEYNMNPADEMCAGDACVDVPEGGTLTNDYFFASLSFPFGDTGGK